MSAPKERISRMTPGLSPAGAWAFAVCTGAGWGFLLLTGSACLAQAGPVVSLLCLLAVALAMLVISRNYTYLMNAFPESGGAYAYARDVFRHDHGFLVSWFLILIYFAVLWAGAASLPLFAEYFLGGVFQFGKLYTVFGADVYLGEALLSATAVLLAALLCAGRSRITSGCMISLTVLFILGVCLTAALSGKAGSLSSASAADSPVFSRIACGSPRAFTGLLIALYTGLLIGFGAVSHSVEEFSFQHTKIFRILTAAVVSAVLVCVCVTLLSVATFPPQYASRMEYIRDLENLTGIEALPAFYAANQTLGRTGVTVLMLSLLALAVAGLLGAMTALNRLFYALGRDGILPARFGKLNKRETPAGATALATGVSVLIPFLGNAVIGWITECTSIGTALVCTFVSASALQLARKRGDRPEIRTGAAGMGIMIVFCVVLLISGFITTGVLSSGSLLLSVIWILLGLICFRLILHTDRQHRFGQSAVVWIVLLSMVLFISLIWMNQFVQTAADPDRIAAKARSAVVVVFILFALSLGVLVSIHRLMNRRAKESETQLYIVRDKVNTDPLTGVKSKHAYTDKENLLDEQIASGTAEPFAVAICDLNGLKQTNDTHGHKAGDELIRNACRMICRIFAHSPVYRVGGDEFVVLLTGEDYDRRMELTAELHRLSVAHISGDGPVVSVGYSDYMSSDQRTENVFDRADANMYAEKRLLKSMGAPVR